ncbi:MAG: hypothetical protein AAB581_03335 [Patescibacteria group bacterium]
MEMSLSLRQSPMLELRQALESSLEQSLMVRHELQMAMVLYQKREDVCTRLYKNALKKGMVKQYARHDMQFEFALVRKKDVPEWIWKDCGHAFSHCLMKGWDCFFFGSKYAMARGSWLLFVIHDFHREPMPDSAVGYAAVHERGEMVTLGDHNLASKLEFSIAAKESKLKWYIEWIKQTCPEKFADIFSYQTHFVLPEGEELRQTLEVFQASKEARKVKQLIEEFEWPLTLLKLLKQYDDANRQALGIILDMFLMAGDVAIKANVSVIQTVEHIKAVFQRGFSEMTSQDLKRYLSIVRLEGRWKDQRNELGNKFSEMLTRREKLLGIDRYLRELDAARVTNSLPTDGILSPDFREVLRYI